MANLCTCVNGPEITCPVHGAELYKEGHGAVVTAEENACAADLWRRLVTIWESAEEDELHDKLGALVDEWQGFVGKEPVIVHFLHKGRAVCGSPGPYDDGGAVNCEACKLEVRSAVEWRNTAREQAQAKEKKGT